MIAIENNVCAVKGEWRTFAVHAYQISNTKFPIREYYYASLPFLLHSKKNFPATNSDDSRNLAMSSLHSAYCMAGALEIIAVSHCNMHRRIFFSLHFQRRPRYQFTAIHVCGSVWLAHAGMHYSWHRTNASRSDHGDIISSVDTFR